MSNIFNYGIACLSLLSLQVLAAPAAVEAFDTSAWAALRNEQQEAIVVFSSVGCTHCPGVIERLAVRRAASHSATRLYVVVMDGDDDAVLLSSPHHRSADRLFAFRASTQSLQYAVNPGWRGMTPYVVYIDGKGGVRFVLGEPDKTMLNGWLRTKQ